MHFDVFYELAVPDFAGRSETQVFHETLHELAVAEAAGFRTAWVVEHHFMRQYSHSSAPELFLAAASQRTQRLRLGHAIVPLPYHHPIHVAERLATLDILSRGRLEFGFGRGFAPNEYAAFDVEMKDSRARVEESLAIIRQSFGGRPIDFQGRHYRLQDVQTLPRVVQQPHPPLWMAAVSPESFELAAAWGVGALVGPFKPWFMVAEDIKRYRQAWAAHHGTGLTPGQNPRVGMTIGLFCLEDGRKARAIASEHITWFYRELLRLTAPVLERLHEGYEYYRRMGSLKLLLEHALNLTALETLGMVVAGDPEHCIAKLEKYHAAGVDHLLCAIGAGGTESALAIESLQTLGARVLPRFTCASS